METIELMVVTLLVAAAVGVFLPVGFWFRNRRIGGQATLVVQPRISKAEQIRLLIPLACLVAMPIWIRPSLREGLSLAFMIAVILFGTLALVFVYPWRLTTLGALSLSGFVTWERIESFRWWGDGRLTMYPKPGFYRFSSATTIVPLAQRGAVDALLREHTHIAVSGIPGDDRPIWPWTSAIVFAVAVAGLVAADLARAAGMAHADIWFSMAAVFVFNVFPLETGANRITRWMGGLVIAAVALHQLLLFLS